ncbi:asparagine synthase (glutamine-hydrolyzing) [Litoribacillus peritrichatus]|uniref:asparagine synthase (glutamine-hydrolyzing) n=1 Tax=Litoribacillus peritrichatus TaxID=718191 RepID=A0ABP7N0Q9_9GAMM
MCGLLFYYSRYDSVDVARFKDALGYLNHRGPDERGLWMSAGLKVALGHCRLSINGGQSGRQPMVTADNQWVSVINGELYNDRSSLLKEGAQFQTKSDSEYLVQSLMHCGERAFQLLDGEFAFAVWHSASETAYLGRDRHGIKPLYFARINGKIIAASEVKALLACGVPSRWNLEYLQSVESFVADTTQTLVKGVFSVPPGVVLKVVNDEVKQITYVDTSPLIPASYRLSDLSFDDAADQFESLFIRAIKKRLLTGGVNACYLSSGIDSSMIAAVTKQYSQKLKTYSIGFEDPMFDESSQASEFASCLDIEHEIVSVSEKTLADCFEASVYHCEMPVPNFNVSAKFFLSKVLSARGHKVALTGEGADESLLGYGFFMQDITSPYLGEAEDGHGFGRLSYLHKRLGYVPAQMAHALPQAEALYNLRNRKYSLINEYSAINREKDSPLICTSQELHYKTVFQTYNLSALADRTEMANAIEGRPSFLDNELVDFIHSLPLEYKFHLRKNKRILRHVAKKYMPESYTYVKKKPFITAPVSFKKTGPLADLFESYILGGNDLPSLYSSSKVRKLFLQLKGQNESVRSRFDPVFVHLVSLMILQKKFNLSL